MRTPQQLFFHSNYKAIESDIIKGYDKVSHLSDKSESTRKLFHQQIEGLENKLILEYIEYIIKQDINDFFKREGLTQLKSYLLSIQYKINILILAESDKKPFEGLLRDLDDQQLDKLFFFLTAKNKQCANAFIKTDKKNFEYVFGGKNKPDKFSSIEYSASNNQWLREIFTELQKEEKYHLNKKTGENTRILSSRIINQIPLFFTKNNSKLEFKGKGKRVSSIETDAIMDFFATL